MPASTVLKINKCNRCEFWHDKDRVLNGYGNPNADIMVLGESPGKLEVHPELEHEPLIGETGAVLNWGMRAAGLITYGNRYKKIFFTNALKCYPSVGDELQKTVDISTKHTKLCKGWLHKEFQRVKPKFVLVLGKHALHQMTGNYSASIEDMRGFWYWSDEFNCWYYPTKHPAVILRNWGDTSAFLRDMERFTNGVKNGVPEQKIGKHYKTIKTIAGVKAVIKRLKRTKRFAWDLETSSLKSWDKNEEILGISFGWKPEWAAYIPLVKEGRKKIWTAKQRRIIIRLVKSVLEDSAIKKDGQNTKFDINWIKTEGIDVKNVSWDTMQFHHLVDENTPANLTYLTTYYDLDFPRYENEIKPYIKKRDGKKTYEFIPVELLSKYACADVDAVCRIGRLQRKFATKRQLKVYRRNSVPISKFTSVMEQKGVLIDVSRIKEMEGEYQKKIDAVNIKLSRSVKRDYFNVASNPQVQAVLFGDEPGCLKLRSNKKTKTGKWSTDKDSFEYMKRKYARKKRVITVLSMIQEVRRMRKMKSTYLTGFIKLVDELNRIHTSYLSTGTVTGRLASEGPNLQNIPKDPIFRSLFIAGPGRKLIAADYSQIEARLLAWLAVELDLIQLFADTNFDPHYYNSSIFRQKPISEVTKEERSIDKAVTFGINYGRSAKSIADEYELDLDFVKGHIAQFFQTFRKIKAWRNRQITVSKKQGWIENKSGRRRHFMAYEWIYSDEMEEVKDRRYKVDEETWLIQGIIGNMERQAINFPIQSYAWDLLTLSTDRVLKRIKDEGIDAYLVLSVHDMIGIDVADEDVDVALKILDEEMPLNFSKTSKVTGKEISMEFPIDREAENCWTQ